MNIIIKKATITDLPAVQALNLKLFIKEQKEYDPLLNLNWTFSQTGTEYFNNRIRAEDGCVLVAAAGNKIVGYLCGGIINKESWRHLPVMAELENFFVLDEFRSRGIGKRLYKEFLKWCKIKAVGKIRVEACAQNQLAIKFYRNNGFKDYTLVLESDL